MYYICTYVKYYVLQDFDIEKKYKLLKQEMDKLGLERRHICEKNEEVKTKMNSVSQQFKSIEDQKNKLLLEDKRIEDECQAIHTQFEKLMNGKSIKELMEKNFSQYKGWS